MTAEPAKPKTTAKKKINKSEAIRELARTIKSKGEKPRPVEMIATLKKQGIVVSSPQVSMVLKRMGFRPRKRRSAGGVDRTGPVATKGGKMKIEDLVKAKKVASQLGGVDKAIHALQALKDFEG